MKVSQKNKLIKGPRCTDLSNKLTCQSALSANAKSLWAF